MQDHKEHTMNYYGFTTEEQYNKFIELSEGPMSNFPQELTDYAKAECNRIGFCGEVLFGCIATYVKYCNGIPAKDLYGPAMKVQNAEEAQEHLDRIIEYLLFRNVGWDYDHASDVALQNLGYFAGYYDAETHERVNHLFNTTHPIFGNDY